MDRQPFIVFYQFTDDDQPQARIVHATNGAAAIQGIDFAMMEEARVWIEQPEFLRELLRQHDESTAQGTDNALRIDLDGDTHANATLAILRGAGFD